MNLLSLEFTIFFLITVTIFYFLNWRWRRRWLLSVSYYFYFSLNPYYALLLATNTLIVYCLALILEETRKTKLKKIIFLTGVAIPLGILLVFKYLGFLTNPLHFSLPIWVIPAGISFYTLVLVGYLVDVYRRQVKAEKNLETFALFVSFLPSILAGPINRVGSLIPQLHCRTIFSYERVSSGIYLILWGLFKKIVVADRLAFHHVNPIFNNVANSSGLSVWIAIYFYSWQIYCDFSAYSDIAVGLARILGIDLTINFKQPYFSSSVREFWRRWHVSLSSWFRDYVYIPLGGNQRRWWHWSLVILLVFALSGLWHGSNWTFVIWGLLLGLFILGERLLTKIRVVKIVGILVTFNLLTFTWIFFRSKTISEAWTILSHLAKNNSSAVSPLLVGTSLLLIFSVIVVDYLDYKNSFWKFLHQHPKWLRWGFYLFLVVLIVNFGPPKEAPFIYFKF